MASPRRLELLLGQLPLLSPPFWRRPRPWQWLQVFHHRPEPAHLRRELREFVWPQRQALAAELGVELQWPRARSALSLVVPRRRPLEVPEVSLAKHYSEGFLEVLPEADVGFLHCLHSTLRLLLCHLEPLCVLGEAVAEESLWEPHLAAEGRYQASCRRFLPSARCHLERCQASSLAAREPPELDALLVCFLLALAALGLLLMPGST